MLTTFIVLFITFTIVQRLHHKWKKDEGVKIEMIRAKIMLQSNDPKEIEDFLLDKEPYLTEEIINQLINRIGELKADKALDDDWDKRYARIATDTIVEEEFLPEEQIMKT